MTKSTNVKEDIDIENNKSELEADNIEPFDSTKIRVDTRPITIDLVLKRIKYDEYDKERTFICPDGQKRLFERHVKLRLCNWRNWRIHFYPVQPGKIIIGYVGRHLPTVKYH